MERTYTYETEHPAVSLCCQVTTDELTICRQSPSQLQFIVPGRRDVAKQASYKNSCFLPSCWSSPPRRPISALIQLVNGEEEKQKQWEQGKKIHNLFQVRVLKALLKKKKCKWPRAEKGRMQQSQRQTQWSHEDLLTVCCHPSLYHHTDIDCRFSPAGSAVLQRLNSPVCISSVRRKTTQVNLN